MKSAECNRNYGAHVAVFVLCIALLAVAILLAVISDVDEVLIIGEQPIPSTCIFKNATGLPCAGCGLTRSWISLADGDLNSSLYYHRFGWLVMLYVIAQTCRHGFWLVWSQRRLSLESVGWWLDRGIVVLMGFLLFNWIFILFD